MRFRFIGKFDVNSQDAKIPGFRDFHGKADGVGLNATVIAAQNNRAFVECSGFVNKTIMTMDTDNNKIEIDWDDRNDEDVVKKIANYKKNVITLNGERHEFVSSYDFITFIRDNLDDIKGKEFIVTGDNRKNEYNGEIRDRFQIQNMFEVTDEAKHQLRVYGEFTYNGDGVDTSEWKSDKKIIFNGYTQEWMNKEHPDALVERKLVFDCSKLDLDDKKHVLLLNYKLKQMGLEYTEGKIKINIKKNAYYKQSVVLSYVNGAEEVPFDESTLTENQKMAIELGLKTIDDFKPAGAIYGKRQTIYKLVDFDMKGDYAGGFVRLEDKPSDIEAKIYRSEDPESEDDLAFMNPPEKKEEESEVTDEDLFS